RLTQTALARLVAAGAAGVSADGITLKPTTLEPAGPATEELCSIEVALLSRLPIDRTDKGKREELAARAASLFAPRAAALREKGYVLDDDRVWRIRCAAVLPITLVLLFLAVPQLIAGVHSGRPVGFLLVTILIGGVLGLAAGFVGLNHLTRRGKHILGRVRT